MRLGKKSETGSTGLGRPSGRYLAGKFSPMSPFSPSHSPHLIFFPDRQLLLRVLRFSQALGELDRSVESVLAELIDQKQPIGDTRW